MQTACCGDKLSITFTVPRMPKRVTLSSKETPGERRPIEMRAPASAARRRLPAKLTRPSATGLLIRERLFAHLDDRKAKCIWISAPAGSGKTSLVSSWIEARRPPCVWYQVDAGDSDPATLFHYLGLAAAATGGRRRVELPHLTPEFLPELQTFVGRFFEAFYALYRTGFILVLDNYQDVAPGSLFHQIIAAAARVLPSGAHLLCVSREPPPATLSRWRNNDNSLMLGWQDVRFTDAEAEALARRCDFGDDSDSAFLNAKARGWVAGFKLLLQAKGRLDDINGYAEDEQQLLFDYLATEVFQRMPRSTRDILVRTAFMPDFSVQDAVQLSGQSSAGGVLSALYSNHLFVDRRSQGGMATYEYHPLFRSFLMSQARSEFRPAEVGALQRQAAMLLDAEGNYEAAALISADESDWAALSRIVCQKAPLLLAQGRVTTLEGWILSLPASCREGDAWVAFWLAAAQAFRDPETGRGALEQSYLRFRAAGNAAGAFMAVAGCIGANFAVRRDAAALDRWISELESLLGACDGALPPEVEVPVLCWCQGIVFRRPDHPILPGLVERARDLAPDLASPDQRYAVGGICLSYFIWRGELVRARMFGNELVQAGTPPPATWAGVLFQVWRAIALWQTAEHDAAEQLLHSVLKDTEGSGLSRVAGHVRIQLASVALSRGDLAAVEQALHDNGAGPSLWQATGTQTHWLLRAAALSLSGKVAEGAAMALEAHGDGSGYGSPFLAAKSEIVCAYILMLADRHSEARPRLEAALAFARSMPSYCLQFSALLALAWSKFETGEQDSAIEHLREGMSIGRSRSFLNCYALWVPEVMSKLMARALEHGIELDYARQLIRKRSLLAPDNRLDLEGWPWPVRIYTLGRFATLIDDKPMQLPARAPRKPLDLLKALIAFGSRGVALDTLAASLWPDQNEDAARNALTVALHRLRKLLGNEGTIILNERRLSLDQRNVWVDAWAFERLTGNIQHFVHNANIAIHSDVAMLSGDLLREYVGRFLADEEASWAVGHRERLHSKFLRATTALTDLLERQRRHQEAIDLHRRVIELDLLAENFHRGLMRNLRALGRIAEAIDAYRRCRHVLSITLGLQPSAETAAIYQDLKGYSALAIPTGVVVDKGIACSG